MDNRAANEHLPPTRATIPIPVPDRVVATLLHLRLDLTTRDLAQLYGTSNATIRSVLRQTRPLLEEHGHLVTPPPRPRSCPYTCPDTSPQRLLRATSKRRVDYLQALVVDAGSPSGVDQAARAVEDPTSTVGGHTVGADSRRDLRRWA
ncbi:transposase family protein [Streptacidiphilus sp. 4-A2]|nr:transposase family protein [Streptacidiphilus sp. 4-A2]